MRKQMTDVERSIHEESEKIDSVKKIVRARSAAIENTQFSLEDLDDSEWKSKAFSNPNATIRLGTVFSGIGAIEHAFQRLKLNHKIVFAGDIEENCRKSYFANYDIAEEDWFTDVREFDASRYKGKVDFVVGGAPCQAFSMVGKRLGFEDARGTLFYEFARVIKETEPKVFLFENVTDNPQDVLEYLKDRITNYDSSSWLEKQHQILVNQYQTLLTREDTEQLANIENLLDRFERIIDSKQEENIKRSIEIEKQSSKFNSQMEATQKNIEELKKQLDTYIKELK